MKSLHKKDKLTIRMSAQELRDVQRLARLESISRGQDIGDGTLVREIALPIIRERLADIDRQRAERRIA